jgi:hypothetical protein
MEDLGKTANRCNRIRTRQAWQLINETGNNGKCGALFGPWQVLLPTGIYSSKLIFTVAGAELMCFDQSSVSRACQENGR